MREAEYAYQDGRQQKALIDLVPLHSTRISPAAAGDRERAMVVSSRAVDRFPRSRHVWADPGRRGNRFAGWAEEALGVTVQIVMRRDGGMRSA
ncbi:hypothetical protein ACSDR0_41565 [Streptosporangium sp. G11]|uniref:hypothetical protein n=1 Tax=Streptosporangium sp. G11 TaxID=3436926 RepID=UPI003EBED300